MRTDYEIKDGFVHIPLKDFEAMKEKIEDLHDESALAHALENIEEIFPVELAKRMIDGDCPVRVFREYRGMTQQQLAEVIGKSKTTISEIENGHKEGSIATLKAIALALDVDLDDLV